MNDKPDKSPPPRPGGALSAFSETELVGFDPGPLGAVYVAGVGYVLDGVPLWRLKETQEPPRAEPAEPAAIVEDEPSPEEPMADAWTGPKRPSPVVNAARRMLQELADGFMQQLLFKHEHVEAWWTLNWDQIASPAAASLFGPAG